MKEDFFGKLSRNYNYNQLRADRIREGTISNHTHGIDATTPEYQVALLSAMRELRKKPEYVEYNYKAQALLELAFACDYHKTLLYLYDAYKVQENRL